MQPTLNTSVSLIPLQIEDEYLKVVIHLADGSNLRVVEEWEGGALVSYGYYWLTADNRLKIGWDNAPHHAELASFPHHKHVGQQTDRRPSRPDQPGRCDASHRTTDSHHQARVEPYCRLGGQRLQALNPKGF